MKTRLVRLALVGGLGAAALVPAMTPAANAMMCSDLVQAVCWTYSTACQQIPAGGKYDLHKIACESLN